MILDEVHAVAGTKRGAHLALSLERLDELLERPGPAHRALGHRAPARRGLHVPRRAPARSRSCSRATPKTIEVDGRGAGARPRRARRAAGARQLRRGGDRLGGGHRAAAVDLARGGAAAAGAGAGAPVHDRVRQLAAAGRAADLAAQRAGRRGGRRAAQELDAFPAEAIGQSGHRRRRGGHRGEGAPRVDVARAAHAGRGGAEGRRCCPAWWPPPAWSWASTWARSTSSCRSRRRRAWRPGCSGSAGPGHQVGAVSTGVVFPKYRGDLVVLRGGRRADDGGRDRVAALPAQPARRAGPARSSRWSRWSRGRSPTSPAVVRRAAPFAALPESALHAVLDMLAGRYPSEEFGELRARITWDRVTDQLRGPPRRAAAGGHLGRHHPRPRAVHRDDARAGPTARGSRVGELDEEMVYESRVGDTFLLGTSSWRVEDITHDRVIVTPAPGQPARMPFWKGESDRAAAGAGPGGRRVRAGDVRR